jgi:hypothetical protein
MHPPIRIANILLVLGMTTVGIGCGGETPDDTLEGSDHALDVYAGLVGKPPTIEQSATPNGPISASAHLLGHVPGTTVEKLADKLVDFSRWKEITSNSGKPTFSASQQSSDSKEGGKRATTGKVTISAQIVNLDIALRGESREVGDNREVRIVNTSPVKTLLTGTVVESGGYAIRMKLVPYADGVVVDATTEVKMAPKYVEHADKISDTLQPMFVWLTKQ